MITSDMVTEVQPHRFVAEASDLRLAPGHFPEFIKTNMGNRLDFALSSVCHDQAVYRQKLGCIQLTIFND
jgi:hypothetical protein